VPVALAFVALGLVGTVLWIRRQQSAEAVAAKHFDLLRTRDWGGIYDLSVPDLKEFGVSRFDFIKLMKFYSGNLPREYFDTAEWKDIPQEKIGNTPGRYHQVIEFIAVPKFDGRPTGVHTQVHHIGSDWKLDSTYLPFLLTRMHGLSRPAHLKLLQEGFLSIGLKRFPQSNGQEIVVDRIPESIVKNDRDYVRARGR